MIGTHARVNWWLTRSAALVALVAFSSLNHAGAGPTTPFGVPLSAPAPANTNASTDTGQDFAPRLATDNQGLWIAVWHSNDTLGGTIGNDNDILYARSMNRGITWSPPAPLNTTAASDGINNDRNACITTDGAGLWICTWESNNPLGGTVGDDLDIFISRSTDGGMTWSPAAALSPNAGLDDGNDFDAVIATDTQGLWITIWKTTDTLTSTIGNDGDILISRSTNDGMTWSFPLPLNTNAETDEGADLLPQLTFGGNGVWVATWYSTDTLGGTVDDDYDIFFASSTNHGLNWTPPAALNSNAPTDIRSDTHPRIAGDGAGHWTVIWSSNDTLGGTIGTDYDILMSRSADDGVTWSPAAALNINATSDAGDDLSPNLALDGSGHWVASWSSLGAAGPDSDLLVARSANNGLTWTAPTPLNTNAGADTGSDDFPFTVPDDTGGFMAVWESRDSLGSTIGTDRDILCARFALPDCNANMVPDSLETDCNNNNSPDDCDIATGSSLDLNNNGIPDECEEPIDPCPPDVAPNGGDGTVNLDDLLFVINNWGAQPPHPADINGDGLVAIDDLLAVITGWGPCP